MRRKRRKFSAEEKLTAVKKHLLEGASSSDICEEYSIHPNQLSNWKQILFENGTSAFVKESKKDMNAADSKIKQLEDKIAHKDNVISEIMSDFIETKKKNGFL